MAYGKLGMGLHMMTGTTSKHPIPENMQIGREIAEEGIVLLKNENRVLPLMDSKVALFGAGAVDTVISGTGSGAAFAPYTVNVQQGLENAGLTITSKSWLKKFSDASKKANKEDKTLSVIDRIWSGLRILIDEMEITDAELEEARAAETAIYVIRRNAGEGKDRREVKGDYYLSDQEEANLKKVASAFNHTVVVLNTCIIDANFLNEISGIDAAVLMGLPGNEAGNALANVLTGKVNPSGRLADTWAKKYSDYPASATFSANDGDVLQEDYNEDIFVGYRYFDSFGIEPLFPFGYGLSYTTFDMQFTAIEADWKQVKLQVEVTNTGSYSGRQVVQVYVSAPEGRLDKPYQELKGFAKTKRLKPGEKETVTVSFITETLASYDETRAAWIMEAGDYIVRVGVDSRNTVPACIIRLDGEANLRQVSNKVQPDHPLDVIRPPKRDALGTFEPENEDNSMSDADALHRTDVAVAREQKHSDQTAENAKESQNFGRLSKSTTRTSTENLQEHDLTEAKVIELHAVDCHTINNVFDTPADELGVTDGKYKHSLVKYPTEGENVPDYNVTFLDAVSHKCTWPAFVNSLDEEVLLRLIAGSANETKYEVPKRMQKKLHKLVFPNSSGTTTNLFFDSLGIPQWPMTDGPAGLHLPTYGTTCFPSGSTVAQTWDPDCAKRMGVCIGKELEAYNYSVILGPGMNIHRDPLCGRNFEYYSEDPLISGKLAAAETVGVQATPGAAVSIKHFCCNNQEEDRLHMNVTVSERALREIYLRGFEICVREAQPKTIMTSYNLTNGFHNTSNYELLTEVVRGEWGFKGLFMSDWGVDSVKAYDYGAGNDLTMGGYRSDFLKAALHGTAPEFAEDGYVKVQEFKVFGGFMTEKVEYWNAFKPDAEGADTVSTTVASGQTLSDKVQEKMDAGIATVTDNTDGSKTITYKGTNLGQTLYMDDVKRSAERVLRQIADSVSYRMVTQGLR